jgi:L-cystine transport system ATP-binding protein
MIEIKGVKKSFGDNHILKGVDMDINNGEVIVIIGPSGSGKTTFLRTLSFLEKADEGKWIENGEETDLHSADKKQIQAIRRKSGFVFQNYNLFANKTVLENVTLGLTVGEGVPKAEAEKRALNALRKVGMAERADFYPNALSGGQQQRVGIARAIARNPEIILFDEPTSALDSELVGEVLKVMSELAHEGVTMIVVTHELAFAREAATKVVFMDGGKVVEQGTPKEILVSPKEDRTRQFLSRILPEFSYSI